MINLDFNRSKAIKIDMIDKALAEYMTVRYPEKLFEAMAYSVTAGGKRLRPLFLLASCEGVGGDIGSAMPFACALEMIHTYSLIHDDLPAMDNDDYRRGKLTNHKVFGEAMAILAGDGLLNLAYEIMAAACVRHEYGINAMQVIAEAAGSQGMVGGQAMDILSENKNVDTDTLLYIHEHKTGALVKAAFEAGGVLGGASGSQLSMLKKAGALFGLAFQIKDDILDVTGDRVKLGKPVKSDEKNSKSTYVSIHGLEKANECHQALFQEAVRLIEGLQLQGSFLLSLMDSLINRDY